MPRRHAKPAPRQPYRPHHDCGRKRRYDSERQANDVKRDQESLHADLKLKTYRCPRCGGWHLAKSA